MNQSMPAAMPTEIVMESSAQLVQITWADGHVSPLRYAHLRKWCPCAACRDARMQAAQQSSGGLRVLPTNVAQTSSDLRDIQQVGSYALNFLWADGHDSGIYAFEMLRDLCECAECRQATNR